MLRSAIQNLVAVTAVALAGIAPGGEPAARPPSAPPTNPAQRIQTGTVPTSPVKLGAGSAHRKRRIILNNDGDDCLAAKQGGAPTAIEEFLKQRTSPLVGSQVDAVFYCGGRCFGSVLHRTDVAENLADHGKRLCRDTLLRHLLDQGTDPLQVMLDFCHA